MRNGAVIAIVLVALFHAERHSAYSSFRIDTALAFTDCGVVAVD
jgi:hypothetical protein